MKKLFTLLTLTITFSMNAQVSTNSTSPTGTYASAMGNGTTASGNESTAMGYDTTASGEASTAMGYSTTATAQSSTAMGRSTTASGLNSTAMGRGTTASGTDSTAMGYYTQGSGSRSTAMGRSTTATDYSSTVIGQYNSSGSSATSANSFSTSAPAFVIGNGANSSNKSDAFKVMFDGTTTIAGDLTINSDARLKANITSLGGTLAKLLKIDGKSYTMKKDQSEKQKIGLLAQDIQKVFPELVLESQGIKSVNYQGLVPVIINALKEQDRKMKEQDRKMREQEERLERLERLVANMD